MRSNFSVKNREVSIVLTVLLSQIFISGAYAYPGSIQAPPATEPLTSTKAAAANPNSGLDRYIPKIEVQINSSQKNEVKSDQKPRPNDFGGLTY